MAKAAKPSGKRRPDNKVAPKPATATGGFSGDSLSIWGKVSWWSLLAMVFIVPIIMSNWTWLGFKLPLTYDQFDIIKVFFQRVLALVALAAWGWDILVHGGKIRRTPIDWLILAFLAWVTISMFMSISPATAFWGKYRRFEGLLSFINYAVIYFLVMQYADRPSRIRALAETLFWSSFVVAFYGILQFIGRDPINWGQLPFEQMRPFSTYGNPDLLGGFLMFSLPVALGLALAEENKWLRLTYWVGFAMNAVVWIVSFTRGAWIGGAIGLVLMVIVAWRHSVKLSLVDWIPAAITALVGGGVIVRSLSNPDEVMNFGARLASITKLQEGSGLTRTEIWEAAIKAIEKRPIFGWGADTFRLVFPKFKPMAYTHDAGYLSVADNVHDYPLQLAAGVGVVGVLLLYGVFVWAAVRTFKLVFGKSEDLNRVVLGALWVACFAYLVQLMFGLSVTGNTFLLWAFMGAVLSPTAKVLEVKAQPWGPAVGSVICVLAVLGIAYQFVLLGADRQYLLARVYYQGPQRTAATLEAVKLNPFNDMYKAEVGLAYTDEALTAYQQITDAQQQGQPTAQYEQLFKEKFDAAEQALKTVIAFVPDEYDNYVFLANLYNIGGQVIDKSYYNEAITWSQKGIAIEPFGPAIRVQMARAYMGLGQNDKAMVQLQQAWTMDDAYSDAAKALAQLYAQQGNFTAALNVLHQTQLRNPTDQDVISAIQQLQAAEASATKKAKVPTPTPAPAPAP